MLHSAKEMTGLTLRSGDGEAGTVKDLYFDDDKWTIRYLVVDTGSWLSGRLVLISPRAITGADWSGQALHTGLTRQQIENSPGIDTTKPVSRQHETAIADYYGDPHYWTGPHLWGESMLPAATGGSTAIDAAGAASIQADTAASGQEYADSHLRSYAEVAGYDIHAVDDSVGHVEDLLVDDRNWSIPLIVIDTKNWLPGKDVLMSPQRITEVNWLDKTVTVRATRAEIENSPEYDPSALTADSGVADLYRHPGTPATAAGATRPVRHSPFDR